jgi:hypothetical protein
MLPYQEDRKLERLLASLFEDSDELTPEDVQVLRMPAGPELFGNCCSYSFGSYNS